MFCSKYLTTSPIFCTNLNNHKWSIPVFRPLQVLSTYMIFTKSFLWQLLEALSSDPVCWRLNLAQKLDSISYTLGGEETSLCWRRESPDPLLPRSLAPWLRIEHTPMPLLSLIVSFCSVYCWSFPFDVYRISESLQWLILGCLFGKLLKK